MGAMVATLLFLIQEKEDLLGLREKPAWSAGSAILGKAQNAHCPPPGAHYHENSLLCPLTLRVVSKASGLLRIILEYRQKDLPF